MPILTRHHSAAGFSDRPSTSSAGPLAGALRPNKPSKAANGNTRLPATADDRAFGLCAVAYFSPLTNETYALRTGNFGTGVSSRGRCEYRRARLCESTLVASAPAKHPATHRERALKRILKQSFDSERTSPVFRSEHRSVRRDGPEAKRQKGLVSGRIWRALPKPPPATKSVGIGQHPGGLFFGYVLLAANKFVGKAFEQPKGGPKGERHDSFRSGKHHACRCGNRV